MTAIASMEFYVIVPERGENLVKNPSPYYRLDGYTDVSSVITLSDTYTRREARCIKVEPTGAGASGVYYSPLPHTDAKPYTFSVDVKGVAGQAMRILIADSDGAALSTTQFIATGNWQRVAVTWTATSTAANARVYVIRDAVISVAPFWVDGFQFEESEQATTFIQGWQPGLGYMGDETEYSWNGQPGSSTSLRSGWTRHGGKLLRVKDYAKILSTIGLGQAPYNQVTTPIVTGGELYQRHFRQARDWGLTLVYKGDSIDEMMHQRDILLDAIRPDATPYDQPLVIRMVGHDANGREVTEPIDMVSIPITSHTNLPDLPVYQKDVLMFRALDGQFRGAYWQGKQFEMKAEYQADYLVKRDPNGRWVNAAGTNPMAGVTGGNVLDIKEAPNGDVYICGGFTGVSNGGVAVANTEGIARWSKANQAWEAVGDPNTGATITEIRTMAFDAYGYLYVGGNFLNLAGIANADYFAWYNPAADTWSTMGGGIDSAVRAIAIAPTGQIYIGGGFSSASGNNKCRHIAYWGGAAWQPLANGFATGLVYTLKFHPDGRVLIGGSFQDANGTAGDYICWWDGSAFHAFTELGADELSPLGFVNSIDVTPAGTIIIGGDFTNAGGDPNADYVARWNGTNWQSLGGAGAFGRVRRVYANGGIYITGEFLRVGNLTLTDRIAVYKNGAWAALEIDLPGVGIDAVACILSASDGSLFLGGGFTGTASAPHITEVMYETTTSTGSANTYPHLEITGPGVLQGIYNYSNGRSLTFNGLTLLDGEKIWLQLDPTNLQIWSSWEGRGSVWRYLNAGSDIGDFYIQPGLNFLGVFVPTGTTLDTTGWIKYQPKFWGLDGSLLS